MIYVSVINGRGMRHLKKIQGRERFVDALKGSEMNYLIIRTSVFFMT